MSNIWILNHHATGMFFAKGGRHHWFAKYLIQAGYKVKIFCGSSRHNGGENLIKDEKLYYEDETEGIPYVFIKTRDYKGNGKSRVLSMIDYYRNVKKIAKNFERPDVIMGSSVHPLACIAAINLSKKYDCKNIVEIRDLWPETIFEMSTLKKNSVIGKLLQQGEKWIYKKADKLIFTMEGYYDYIIAQGWENEILKEKCEYINNGVDLELFNYNKENSFFEDEDLEDRTTFKVIYTGSMGKANNIDYLLDTAKLIKNKKIKVIIYGSGTEKERLKKRVVDENIENVIFKKNVEKKYVPFILSKANVNTYVLVPSKLYRLGLSLNKSFEYFASGKPVLASENSGYSIIDEYRCGTRVKEYNEKLYSNAIDNFADMEKEDYEIYCKNALKAAEHFDFKILTKKLIEIIEG